MTAEPAPNRASTAPIGPGDVVLCVDGTNILHRSHWALAGTGLTRASDGAPVWALHGTIVTIAKLLEQYRPTHVVVAFDTPGGIPSRLTIAPWYKANRGVPTPELFAQLLEVAGACTAAGIACVAAPGWEADDVLASLATTASTAGARALVVTSDRDAYQLVGPLVSVVKPDGTLLGPAEVHAATGVPADRYAELAAIRGEASDNLPGVPGVGPKWAAKLIGAFATLDDALGDPERLAAVTTPRIAGLVTAHADTIRTNLAVGRLNTTLDVAATLERAVLAGHDHDVAAGLTPYGLHAAAARLAAALAPLTATD